MADLLPTRPTYHHGDLRNSLIQAALTLVAERGVDGFSLRGAARTVGVSPSACYRHFADREALLAAVAHEGLDKLAADMRTAAAPYPDVTPHDAVRRFWSYSSAYLHFALSHPAHFRVMHALPKSEQSRVLMLPRTPAVLAQAAMADLVEAGVVAPETAGRALLACWTSVHGLASLAVSGQLPVGEGMTFAVPLDAVLRTALIGAGVDASLLPPELPLPGGACPGIADMVRDAAEVTTEA
jgi:AcrR family transcriptional regulator